MNAIGERGRAPLSAMGASAPNGSEGAAHLRIFVFGLFFIFGGITSLNDVVIPKLRSLFTLSYGEVMLVQSAFFAAYFLVSIPAAKVVQRIGYMRTAVVGLMSMAVGCLLFIPASNSGLFITFLLALFVLASGITIVQVVANPLISMLGSPATAHSRLTFAQAFNSLGTTIFPYVGLDLDFRLAGDRRSGQAQRRRTQQLPHRGQPGHRPQLSGTCGCAGDPCCAGLVPAPADGRAGKREPELPPRAEPHSPKTLWLRRRLHFPVCRC